MNNICKIYSGLGKDVYVLAIARAINSLGYFVIPFLSLYMTSNLLLSVTIAGVILAIANAVSIPMTLIGGWLCKKYENKVIIIVPQICSALAFIGVVCFNSVIIKVICAILGFCISNIAQPALDACLGARCEKDNKSRAFSLIYFAQNIGFGLGSIVVGAIYNINVNYIFLGDAITTIFCCIMLSLFLSRDCAVDNNNSIDSTELKKSNRKKFDYNKKEFFLILILNALAYGQISFVLPLYLNDTIGSNSTILYGILMGINSAGVILLSPILTQLFDKRSLPKTLLCAELFFMIGYAMYAISINWLSFSIATIIWTTGEVLFSVSFMAYLVEDVPKTEVGMISSIATSFYKFGSILSSLVGALFVLSVGYKFCWYIVSLFLGVGAIIMIILIKKENVQKST
ncbi:MAG: MFS transporter [Clostridium sp.]